MDRTSHNELVMLNDFAGAMIALMMAKVPTAISLKCSTTEARQHHQAAMERLSSLGMVESWRYENEAVVFVSGKTPVTMEAFRTTTL